MLRRKKCPTCGEMMEAHETFWDCENCGEFESCTILHQLHKMERGDENAFRYWKQNQSAGS